MIQPIPDRGLDSPSRGGPPEVLLPSMGRSPRGLWAVHLAWVVASAGCTLGGPPSLEPRDSYPHVKETRSKSPTLTGLVVSTERFLDLTYSDEGPQLRPTGYTVYDEKGLRVLYVRNFIGITDTHPTRVPLEPGRYLVLLEKPADRTPVFWVTVEADRTTEVDVNSLPMASPGS
jgi:hypothetical protein